LGIGSVSADQFEPVQTQGVLSGKAIVQVATNSKHSLFLSDDGLVFACGDNT
jgi:alpha-tubulin suppressor-like RCC1 family protein